MADSAIKVIGRTLHKVNSGFLIDPLGIDFGIKEDGLKEGRQLGRVGAGGGYGESGFGTTLDQGIPISRVKFGDEFAGAVMVVDTVAKPYSFGIDHELFPARVFAVPFVVLYNVFNGFADQKVVSVILVPNHIVTGASGLAEVIQQFLLLKG